MGDKHSKTHTDVAYRDRQQIDEAVEHIREALVGLQFGEVLVILQDGVIVQLERTERKRFRKSER
jgi:hypothetical protein